MNILLAMMLHNNLFVTCDVHVFHFKAIDDNVSESRNTCPFWWCINCYETQMPKYIHSLKDNYNFHIN